MGNCIPSQWVGRVRRTRLSAGGGLVGRVRRTCLSAGGGLVGRVRRTRLLRVCLSADGWRARRARPTFCGWVGRSCGALGEHALPVVGGITCCGCTVEELSGWLG